MIQINLKKYKFLWFERFIFKHHVIVHSILVFFFQMLHGHHRLGKKSHQRVMRCSSSFFHIKHEKRKKKLKKMLSSSISLSVKIIVLFNGINTSWLYSMLITFFFFKLSIVWRLIVISNESNGCRSHFELRGIFLEENTGMELNVTFQLKKIID